MADNNFLSSLLNYGQSFAQGASNSIAGNVSAPIDGMAWLLRRAGVPMPSNPVGGSDWMNQQGLTPQPQVPLAGMLGEAAGMAGPMVAAAKAPKIAGGLLRMGENAMVPNTLGKQAGVMKISDKAAIDYQIQHKPMTIEGGAAPLHDLTKSFGDDVYGANALQYYGSGDAREKYALELMRKARGNPDAPVTIYRGVPDGVKNINAGDWVTLHPGVASEYGKTIKMEVPASHITSWPDSLLEFGYHPPK